MVPTYLFSCQLDWKKNTGKSPVYKISPRFLSFHPLNRPGSHSFIHSTNLDQELTIYARCNHYCHFMNEEIKHGAVTKPAREIRLWWSEVTMLSHSLSPSPPPLCMCVHAHMRKIIRKVVSRAMMGSEVRLLWNSFPCRNMVPESNLPPPDYVFLGKLFYEAQFSHFLLLNECNNTSLVRTQGNWASAWHENSLHFGLR